MTHADDQSNPQATTFDFQSSCPKLRDDLRFIPKKRRHGEPWFRVEDTSTRRFHRIGIAEYEFLLTLNGRRTLDECRQLSALASQQQRVLTAQQAESLILWAANESLLEGHENAVSQQEKPLRDSLAWLKVPLFYRDTDWQPLTQFLSPLFSGTGIVLSACLWLVAISMVIVDADRFLRDLASIFQPGAWLSVVFVWLALKVSHEAGHIACCHRYGGRVEEAGIAWMLIAPVAYVDLTDVYRIPSRLHRIMTCLAGIYVELFIAALSILGWWFSTSPGLSHFSVTTACTASVSSILFNLNPLMRLDGYHAICDWLDQPNLGTNSQKSLRSVASLIFLGRRKRQEPIHLRLAAYGFASFVYRIVVSLGIVSAAYAMYGQVAMAVILFALTAGAMPQVIRVFLVVLREFKQRPSVAIRMTALGACFGVIGFVGFQTRASFQSGWYGMVEYEDDAPVRCAAPGRVIRIMFKPGDHVVAGQPLVELENLSVHAERVAAECEWERGHTRWNRYREMHFSAEAASEKRANDAIKTRLEHLVRQEESLIVRATRDGKAIARAPENWVGQWMEEGDALLHVVDETKKKVIVAIPQSDMAEPVPSNGSRVQVIDVNGKSSEAIVTSITRQADLASPHPAMTAIAGGRLAVRAQQDEETVTLVTPHVRLEAMLADPDNTLWTGQQIRVVRGSWR